MSAAPARLARLLTLVPYLLARPGVPVAQAAADFDISVEQLVDDLQLLFVCGLPGHLPDDLIDVDLSGDTIHLSNADAIARPLRLDQDEVVTLLAGLRMLADLQVDPGADVLERITAKLERAAGDALGGAASGLVVDAGPASAAESEALTGIRTALTEGRAVALRYYVPGRDELTDRVVDPMRLLVVDGRAYLEGWCRRAEGVRLFRTDRIDALRVLDEPAAVPEQARPRDVSGGLFQPTPQDVHVVLVADPPARWVAEYYPTDAVDRQPDGSLRIALRVADPSWVVRLVLRMGGALRIEAPAELAAEAVARARAALAGYATP
jgi:proteasome accessory factor C